MFTPVESTIGAFLLHEATSVLLFQNGNVLGASGFLRQMMTLAPSKGTMTFIAGMVASLLPLRVFLPELVIEYPSVPTTLSAALITVGIGAIIGWGSKLGKGCTSGHMLCGLSRLSPYSIAAVATFFPVALITHHLVHPSLRTELCPAGIPCYTPVYPSTSTATTLLLLATIVTIAGRFLPKLLTTPTTKTDPDSPARQTTRFLSGLEFGLGLQITGMAHPSKVLSFLSFPNMELWDPSMGFVILFGIVPNMIEFFVRGMEKAPEFNEKFEVPKRKWSDVDIRLVAGAAAFGVGWGLSGTCPGPAFLRAVVQPVWGALWMGGFYLGGKIIQ